MRITKSFLVALALIAPLAAFHAAPAQAGASVSLGFFYDSLSQHGNWYASADFGYVWRPAHVSVGWRPYVDGRWAHSEVGWTFVSYDPWGWAAYHYGRWYLDPYYGWVWVPGYEWAPAWVTFYEGPGWIGWAPLPPRVSIGVAYASPIRIDARAYCFVESRYFLDPYVGRRIQPIGRNSTLVRSVRDVSRFDRVRGVAVNRGLSVDRVERATSSRVRTFRLVDHVGASRPARAELRGDSLSVFRPRIEQRAVRPPKVTQGRPARFETAPHRAIAPSIDRRNETERAGPPARIERPTTTRSSPPSTSRSRVESTAPQRKPPERTVSRSEPARRAEVRKPASSAKEPVRRAAATTAKPSGSGAAVRSQPDPKGDPRVSKEAPTSGRKSTATAKERGAKKTTSKPSSERKPPHLG